MNQKMKKMNGKKTRLIDAEALKERIITPRANGKDLLTELIDSMPTIDAVPVTRCYECKYIYYEDGLEWKCTRTDTLIDGIEGYCSWAEPEVKE